ncbi:alpha/beta fold hydrolase [Alicyclobacillus sp.]|uniref:alpha/beta hydrolase n=1 Tax=Alicyclobacillus sp. TaxID=61169 RepID=UPI0025B93793|nr:alpha/beta fold hydrolase [Alicyclobacillus sp.]MCL6517477.1 alpha/beta fold hydrolase [Alicyclobacillus sp.]
MTPSLCVLVHGFTGSPEELTPLAERLQDAGYDVVVPTLAGHGGDRDDLRTATASAWIQSVVPHVRNAVGKRPVHLVGFSMGAMICAVVARRQSVTSLTMLAPAVYYVGPTQMFRQIAGVIKDTWGTKASPGQLRQRIDKVTSTPLQSLMQFRRAVLMGKSALPHLTLPVCVVQGEKDELVEPRSALYVHSAVRSECKELHMIPNAGHMLCYSAQADRVGDIVLNFLDRVDGPGHSRPGQSQCEST